MTQQFKVTTDASVEKAWGRIGNSDWNQMAWFVKLANASDFSTMTPGEQLLWQEEFMAMLLREQETLSKAPMARNGYPRSNQGAATIIDWPTSLEMVAVRDVVRQPINRLADGETTWIPEEGTFNIDYSVKFTENPRYSSEQNEEPRYLVYHNEVKAGSYPQNFLLRMLRLLESYPDKNRRYTCADKLRRCLKCKKVFLQVKRSSSYCGPACYTVACMRRLREGRKSKLIMKQERKTPASTAREKARV